MIGRSLYERLHVTKVHVRGKSINTNTYTFSTGLKLNLLFIHDEKELKVDIGGPARFTLNEELYENRIINPKMPLPEERFFCNINWDSVLMYRHHDIEPDIIKFTRSVDYNPSYYLKYLLPNIRRRPRYCNITWLNNGDRLVWNSSSRYVGVSPSLPFTERPCVLSFNGGEETPREWSEFTPITPEMTKNPIDGLLVGFFDWLLTQVTFMRESGVYYSKLLVYDGVLRLVQPTCEDAVTFHEWLNEMQKSNTEELVRGYELYQKSEAIRLSKLHLECLYERWPFNRK